MILRYTICEMRDSYSGSVWREIHKYRYITIIVWADLPPDVS